LHDNKRVAAILEVRLASHDLRVPDVEGVFTSEVRLKFVVGDACRATV
jgi:hypothetical protein